MPRVPFRRFEEGGEEVSRVYLAASVAESTRVEEALDEAGLRYAVEVEPFSTLTMLGAAGSSTGAAFYVLEREADGARRALASRGLRTGLLQE